jgi:hypothetical protein
LYLLEEHGWDILVDSLTFMLRIHPPFSIPKESNTFGTFAVAIAGGSLPNLQNLVLAEWGAAPCGVYLFDFGPVKEGAANNFVVEQYVVYHKMSVWF